MIRGIHQVRLDVEEAQTHEELKARGVIFPQPPSELPFEGGRCSRTWMETASP
jgi:hypothetical protein